MLHILSNAILSAHRGGAPEQREGQDHRHHKSGNKLDLQQDFHRSDPG